MGPVVVCGQGVPAQRLKPADVMELARAVARTSDRAKEGARRVVEAELLRAGVGDRDAAIFQPHGAAHVKELVLRIALQHPDHQARLGSDRPLFARLPASGPTLDDHDSAAVPHGAVAGNGFSSTRG